MNNFIMYKLNKDQVEVEVLLKDETIWITQSELGILFDVDRSVITKHLKNIFTEDELDKKSVCANFAHTASDGKKYNTNFYNLDAIISVGYRVNSKKATMFRKWATSVLKEYTIKGFVLNDKRMKKNSDTFGKDYFDELLERIRDIRSSERKFYQKITDIYELCSADYNRDTEITNRFFATVQNKLHYAITGNTAAELIYSRADSEKENMGLTNWKNSPKGKIRKSDVIVAKNYLNEKELKELNIIVSMYLDYAELQANNNTVMYMKDWKRKLDKFLEFNEKEILKDSGKIKAEIAREFALEEYSKFSEGIEYKSDFDLLIDKSKKMKNNNKG